MTQATTNKTATPATAAKPEAKPESKSAAASRVAPLNFAALSFQKTDAVVRKPSRTRNVEELKPFIEQLRASWNERDQKTNKGTGRAVNIPNEHGTKVVGMVRVAGEMLAEDMKAEIGTQIVKFPAKDESGKLIPGMTTVAFCAKRRRATRTRSQNGPVTVTNGKPVEAAAK